MWTDNPTYDADRYWQKQEEKLARRPKCFECGEHIQDETGFHFFYPRLAIDFWICHKCKDACEELID